MADITLTNWLTMAAIVIGPIVAVVISELSNHKREQRGKRVEVLRTLLSFRRLPGDPRYSLAINLIPVEFNSNEEVMKAWRVYHATVHERVLPVAKEDHELRMAVKQSALIFQMMQALGFKLSEGDIQTESYVSQGLVDRDRIYMESLLALPEMAATMKQQHELLQAMYGGAQQARQAEQAAQGAALAPKLGAGSGADG